MCRLMPYAMVVLTNEVQVLCHTVTELTEHNLDLKRQLNTRSTEKTTKELSYLKEMNKLRSRSTGIFKENGTQTQINNTDKSWIETSSKPLSGTRRIPKYTSEDQVKLPKCQSGDQNTSIQDKTRKP